MQLPVASCPRRELLPQSGSSFSSSSSSPSSIPPPRLLFFYAVCVCDSAEAWNTHWPCCQNPWPWRRKWPARPTTGGTRSHRSFSPHSAQRRWTARPSYMVRSMKCSKNTSRQWVDGASLTTCSSCSPLSSELFTTEVSHLRTLRVLEQVFYQKMRSVLNAAELACIFPNLPQVYELHGQTFNTRLCG